MLRADRALERAASTRPRAEQRPEEPAARAAVRWRNRWPGRPVVCVVGLGYVGLPTALSLRDSGSLVLGLDASAGRREALTRGDVDLPESGRERLREALSSDELLVTGDDEVLAVADAVVVCVPTPVDEHLVPDLRALEQATATVVRRARAGQTLVLTSTTYVGSTRDLLVRPLQRRGLVAGQDVSVAFSPERIDPGVDDHRPERTPRIVGGVTPECTRKAVELLGETAGAVHEVESPEVAEMAKLLENTFRAVNIALANEMADIASELGVPITQVIDAAATKPYGFMPFQPGPGVGGHCIPCDPHYLLWQLREHRFNAPLIDTAMTQVAGRPRRVVDRVSTLLAERARPLIGSHVHLVGVAYKPGVADVRESPALKVAEDLLARGATVSYEDAHVDRIRVDGHELTSTRASELGRRPDAVVLHTLHPGVRPDLPDDGRTVVLDATYRYDGATSPEVL